MARPRWGTCIRGSFSRDDAQVREQIAPSRNQLLQQRTCRPHCLFAEILPGGWRGSRCREGRGERFTPAADSGTASQTACRERSAGLRQSFRGACRAIPERDRRKIVVLGGRIVSESRGGFARRKKFWIRRSFRSARRGKRRNRFGGRVVRAPSQARKAASDSGRPHGLGAGLYQPGDQASNGKLQSALPLPRE